MNRESSERVITYCRLKPSVTVSDSATESASLTQRVFLTSRGSNKSIAYGKFEYLEAGIKKKGVTFEPPSDCIYNDLNYGDSGSIAFTFEEILAEDCSQEEIFEKVARPLLEPFLGGINTCVCCYGQTGSGKTWTMSGGDSFQSRGLIQRIIEELFCVMREQSIATNVFVSYMEVYNEVIYDLLGDASRMPSNLEGFPRVTLREDENGTVHTRNLTLHAVQSPEEALNIFLYGNMNRMVSSTLMNQASSRSHCIFTLHNELSSANTGSVIRSSKFHLVDLAGSERVWKTGLCETTLREARYINKSLHHFEQVMHALYQKQNHIPYRNSVLTSVLRESLGGNYRTVLIANVSLDSYNFKETLATCRFIQRCGHIKRPPIHLIEPKENHKDNKQTHCQVCDSLRKELNELRQQTFRLKPRDQFAFTDEKLQDGEDSISIRDLQERCGSNLSQFPREIRKSLVEKIRLHETDYRVTNVGDLCAIIQVLIAKLNQSDARKRELEDALRGADKEELVEVSLSQWSKSCADMTV